jgi:ABC-type polysaccharide/polyol phosphate export permease
MLGIFENILKHRHAIQALALRELKSRYAGTLAGTFWMIFHPIAIVAVFYFVFAVGFKAKAPGSAPFILWFVTGLIAWFYFNDTLLAITDAITRNAHLVKKTIFPTEILPLVQIVAGIITHGVFLGLTVIMLVIYKVHFEPARLLIVYFMLCTTVLLLGMGWLLAALQVFYRDIAQALTITMNLLFWMTPIVWVRDQVPAAYRGLLSLNPVYYLVEGYRDLLIYPQPILPTLSGTIVFWSETGALLLLGATVFQRLKPEFADLL